MSEEHRVHRPHGAVPQQLRHYRIRSRTTPRIGDYQLGILVVPLAAAADVAVARQRLEEAAASVCAAFVAPAEVALRELEGEQFVVMPSAEPRVTLRLVDADRINLVLRYPCPASQRTRTEQDILARYLADTECAARATGGPPV